MLLKGLQKTTLLDYPGKVACTVFTGGCNFRCPFCHNASLVTAPNSVDTISEESFFSFLSKRKGILDGVCVTGGEPMLMPDLEDFCQRIKDMDFAVKLDTNGSYPQRLRQMIEKGLVDYVAMDIKNSLDAYAETCGLSEFPHGVEESMDLLMQGSLPFEFRTTVVREFHTAERIEALAKRIAGCERYFLQLFTDSGDLIESGLSAPSESMAREWLEIARKYVPNAALRGI